MPDANVPTSTTIDAGAGSTSSKGLAARVTGVIFSPRATYTAIAARPKVFGALVLVLLVVIATTGGFLATDVGKKAYIDQALSTMEGFGQVNDQQMAGLERMSQIAPYITGVAQLVFIPLVAAIIAALCLAIFNALLGGDASFKQVFAVVIHSYVIVAIGALFSTPLYYLNESMASPTSLHIFLPMIDEATFAGRLFGALDLFRIWWLVSLAIGLGVLYKRKTGSITWTFLTLYLVFVLIYAGIRTALSASGA